MLPSISTALSNQWQGGTFLRGSGDDHQPADVRWAFFFHGRWVTLLRLAQLLKGSCRRPEDQVKIVFVPLVGCSRAYFHIRELTLNPTPMPTSKALTRVAEC